MSQTYAFQAEINQLLSLIINTFYSNKEVFLRELISNASDALDKAKYAVLTGSTPGNVPDMCIKLVPNQAAGVLTIQDNGIGMSQEELIKNLGTIAHSGTKSFIESLKEGVSDMSLIGQFGVGFYSAFLVADKVRVVSKRICDDKTWAWESDAGGTFTVSEVEENLDGEGHGTTIELHLKEDQKDYLTEGKLREVVNKHSQYIGFPIKLRTEREEEVEVDGEEDVVADGDKEDKATAEDESKAAEDSRVDEDSKAPDEDGKVEEVTEEVTDGEEPPKPKEKKKVTKVEFETLNKQQPVWMRKPDDVTHEEYASFYKSIANDWEDHLAVKHFAVEGQVEFKGLLFVPPRPPFDIFSGGVTKKLNNVKLYVKKVLITDNANDILPEYLSFIKGVIDSDDLPLNVSREMLQQNNIMKVIKKNIIKKTLEMLTEMAEAEDKDKWKKCYEGFSKNIKLGVIEDYKMREKLVPLLRFHTSKMPDDEMASLKDYVTRMKEGQKDIFYVTGESLASVKNLACIEKVKKRGYEVIYLVDAIDEYMISHLSEHDGKKMVNCSREGFSLEETDEEKKAFEETKVAWADVCKAIKDVLGEKVKDVVVSNKIVSRPCVLVSDQYGWTANMERIMKAQALRNNEPYMFMGSKKIMEINPEHAIMKTIKEKVGTGEGASEGAGGARDIKPIVQLLYDTVLIDSGFSIEDPSNFTGRIYRLIQLGLSGGEDDELGEGGLGGEAGDAEDVTNMGRSEGEVGTTMEEVD